MARRWSFGYAARFPTKCTRASDSCAVESFWYVMAQFQISLAGNVIMSKRVTMPKLFPPPLRARKRSGLVFSLAFTILPSAKTTS